MIHVGCCGWGYLDCKQYFGSEWKEKFASKLQAYAALFDLVEVNSTFYKIPKPETAERWREEASAINKRFEFSVKCSRTVTHEDAFSTSKSVQAFEKTKEIAELLKSKIILFQSPASFKPTIANITKAKKFFENIDREHFVLAWEVRWQKSWTKPIVSKLFKELNLLHCVDPLRQEVFRKANTNYFRLHGFGKRSMYDYKFSDEELKKLKGYARKKECYILFNNYYMYEDALRFKEILL